MKNAKRIDRLGDIFASGALAAVPNSTDRLCLFTNALVSGSDPAKYNYRLHFYSDRSIAKQIGRRRESVNKAQARLKRQGIISRSERKKGCSQRTVIADYPDLITIAEQHDGEPTDIKPAPRPAGEDFRHFPDEVLESKILKSIPGAAGEVLLLIAWLVQPDPQAHDFCQYNISITRIAAILYREAVYKDKKGREKKDHRTIRRAIAVLTDANLIAREGNTITLQAHSAEQLKYQPVTSAKARPFDAEAQARCQHARQKADTDITGKTEEKADTDITPPRTRTSHPPGHGHHTPPDTDITRTNIEPLKKTITKNHRGHHPLQNLVDPGQVNTHRNGNSADPEITPDPPAPQTNDEIRHEHNQLIDILNRPPVTPEDHKRQEEAQERLYELTRGKKRAPIPDPTPPAAEVDAEPAPLDDAQAHRDAQKARLTALVKAKEKDTRQYNQEIRDINAKIAKIEDKQLPAAEEAERIDALIAACIATLDPEPQPDLLRQAQEADREYRQAKIVHRNRSRKPERNAVHPWTPAQAQAAPVPPQPGQHAQG